MTLARKKLIEVTLPLRALDEQSAREKGNPFLKGHPRALHQWWARRPNVLARGLVFANCVDDPSAWPDLYRTEGDQDEERARLFRILEQLVDWDNSDSEVVLNAARLEIARSVARGRIADGSGDSRDDDVMRDEVSAEIVLAYLADRVPPVHDPFAGGGAIPVEAQRVGLRSVASDLNPIAVMINKVLIEIPPKFAERPPVGPLPDGPPQEQLIAKRWRGSGGLAEDVRRYSQWMQDEAVERIGHFYPSVVLPEQLGGGEAPVIAWLWARTVHSPSPAFNGIDVPLVRSFSLSSKKGKRAWVEPIISADRKSYEFVLRTDDDGPTSEGTVGKAGATCLLSGDPIPFPYIREEAKKGRMGARMLAVVAGANRRRVYLSPTEDAEGIAKAVPDGDFPDTDLPPKALGFRVQEYGMLKHRDLFTSRQLLALQTFSDLILEARKTAIEDATNAGWVDDAAGLEQGGVGATAYGDALAVALQCVLGKACDYWNSLTTWNPTNSNVGHLFARHAIPMVWDFPEANPLSGGLSFSSLAVSVAAAIELVPARSSGTAALMSAQSLDLPETREDAPIFITDPPYYDNIGYADLSDFFYVWARRSLANVLPSVFSTVLVPKSDELVASRYRHGSKAAAEEFFLEGVSRAIAGMASRGDSRFPISFFYAFKQAEVKKEGLLSTGWETFLTALVDAGLAVVATWPVRSERVARSVGRGTNALASSIVLVCRKRQPDARTISRGDFRRQLKQELPHSLGVLQKGSIAPVDMAQASIGPGMGIFSAYSRVLEADGSVMTVRSALQLIHEVTDEVRGEDEGDLDRDTRFAITWFESYGFAEGPYGEAEMLATARSVSVSGVRDAGILRSAAGKVRLLTRQELPADWTPETDDRLTVWEATQHLIKRLNEGGESAAADLIGRLGLLADDARNLAYRLYTTCDRKGMNDEAQAYNGLVLAWPELERLAGEAGNDRMSGPQADLFE